MAGKNKLVGNLLVAGLVAAILVALTAAVFGLAGVADQAGDFFTPDWERHKSVYDPRLRVERCLDKQTGNSWTSTRHVSF
jgi:hypothetical protein